MRTPASLDVVADTVRRELDPLERRTDAADARAGLVLGFAGLLGSFGSEGWLPLTLGARSWPVWPVSRHCARCPRAGRSGSTSRTCTGDCRPSPRRRGSRC